MKMKILLVIPLLMLLNSCGETEFSTNDSGENGNKSLEQNGTALSTLSIERVNSDIKEGKVAGWKSAKTQQERYLALLNYFRSLPVICNDAKANRGPLESVEWSDALEAAAQEHSEDLLEHGVIGHRGSDGSTAAQRVEASGFEGEYISENVGYKMKEGIPYSKKEWIENFVAWMQSRDGHCSNIMSKEYNRFGMAEAKSIEGESVTLYWTQDFGLSRD